MKIIVPVLSYSVTLPNGVFMSGTDIKWLEKFFAFLNGLEEAAEPKNDAPDKDYNHFVGSLVGRMPPNSSLIHDYGGGWKYRDKDGSVYGTYVNVHDALNVLSKP